VPINDLPAALLDAATLDTRFVRGVPLEDVTGKARAALGR
jgi:hypothetical protein